jgi:xanthine permease XanP
MPPISTLAVLGLQHAIESASKVTLPVALLLTLGAGTESMQTMIAAALIAAGVCSIVVSSRHRVFDFGLLTPSAIVSSLIAPAIVAMQAGGLKMLAGMMLVTGPVVVLLSRVLQRWRALFPPEVVRVDCVHGGHFAGEPGEKVDPQYLLVASITLALLAGLTVWGKGRVRLFSSVITLVVATRWRIISALYG